MISINAQNSWPMLVALLGHELQHAVEVADSPGVASDSDLAALYRRIGIRTALDAYDSRAAQNAGQVVRREFLENPADSRLARRVSAHERELLAGGSIAEENR